MNKCRDSSFCLLNSWLLSWLLHVYKFLGILTLNPSYITDHIFSLQVLRLMLVSCCCYKIADVAAVDLTEISASGTGWILVHAIILFEKHLILNNFTSMIGSSFMHTYWSCSSLVQTFLSPLRLVSCFCEHTSCASWTHHTSSMCLVCMHRTQAWLFCVRYNSFGLKKLLYPIFVGFLCFF